MRRMRKSRNWTLPDLSRELESTGWPLSPKTLSKIETGKRALDINDLAALSTVFDIPMEHLTARSASADRLTATLIVSDWREARMDFDLVLNDFIKTGRAIPAAGHRLIRTREALEELIDTLDVSLDELLPFPYDPSELNRSHRPDFSQAGDAPIAEAVERLLGGE